MSKEGFFCSTLSLEAAEEMFASAPRVDVWLLLEYREAWDENAFPSSRVPEVVKKRLSGYLGSIPNCRLQLIKRHNNPEGNIRFYIGISDEIEPRLFEFSLSGYEDVLSLDIPKIMRGSHHLRSEPLFLVCTHGTHDKCCGKFGVPVYMEAAKQENGSSIWQCTHVGGHRFAANLLCLPHGIYYGRVREYDVGGLIGDYKNGHINLKKYRGRSCYSPDAQAAEYFLRVNTSISKISGFRLKEIRKTDEDNSIVGFISETDKRVHLIEIQRNPHALENYTSCKDENKSPIAQYRLIGYRTL